MERRALLVCSCPVQEGGRTEKKILQKAELGSRCPGKAGGRAEGKVSEVWWLFLVS